MRLSTLFTAAAVRQWGRARRRIGAALAATALLLLLVLCIATLLGPLSWRIAGTTVSSLQGKDRADAINGVRQTLLAAVGGSAALVGIAFTVRGFFLARRGQITDRYSKAITQMASGEPAERLGGIYALEHVLLESPADHNTIVTVLTSFVRQHAGSPQRTLRRGDRRVAGARSPRSPGDEFATSADVQAALDVLGRRPRRPESSALDRGGVDLRGADLVGVGFEGALLSGARLEEARLLGAHLEGAVLIDANLEGAYPAGRSSRTRCPLRIPSERCRSDGRPFRRRLPLRAASEGGKVYDSRRSSCRPGRRSGAPPE